MNDQEILNLLVVGIDTVAIANSAKEAGYKIYAADYFGDMDLQRVCSGWKAILKQRHGKSCGKIGSRFKPEAFLKMTKSLVQKHEIDGILLSSGLDSFSDLLYKLNDLVPILGNPPEIIKRIQEEQYSFQELDSLGINHPETAVAESLEEAEGAAEKIGCPVVVKPIRSLGGSGIRIARNSEEMRRTFLGMSLSNEKVLIQSLIDGIHASVSFISTDTKTEVLTMNEQLLGIPYLFQHEPFGYCGNIVPLWLPRSLSEKCSSITEKIASHFNLTGSNGIDLIISEEGIPYVVEINPRFQGTLECVNRVLGINLVKSHMNACLHCSLPKVEQKTSIFCSRLVLYAPKRVVAPNLNVYREVRDIPLPGTIIEKREPLCSVLTEGKSRKLSFTEARRLAESIYGILRPA